MHPTGARRLRADDYSEPRPARHLRAVQDAEAGDADRMRSAADALTAGSYPPASGDLPPVYAQNGRRTVTITGHPVPSRRRAPTARSDVRARPDRIALWAVLLGLFLVFMAVATANAAAL